ncbi:MAG TPA: hypothetical protein VIZ43_29370 [Trebonia sp.]
MRELRGWQSHGEHRHGHARDAAADIHPRHSADTPRFRVLADPEVRKAEFLKYQKAVQQDDAKYEPKHAIGRFKPQEAKPEHAPPEARDKPASRIASPDNCA